MIEREFSHAGNFPIYMERVQALVASLPRGRLLDCPAGSGRFIDRARALGFDAVGADINTERPDYVYCDMEARLPFDDGAFDVTVSMEGIEHLVGQSQFLRELVRVTRPGGHIVISTPNTANFYSRLKFLFTGSFGQFPPHEMRAPTRAKVDLGHIHPIAPLQLAYLMQTFGAELKHIDRDRLKRLKYLPLFALLWPLMALASWRLLRQGRGQANSFKPATGLWKLLMGRRLMWSRSTVVLFQRSADAIP